MPSSTSSWGDWRGWSHRERGFVGSLTILRELLALKPNTLRPGQFIDALKLRTNTFGTKVALGRGKTEPDVLCRRCGMKPGTLSHVLGECIAGKRERIVRHNWLVGRIARQSEESGF